MVGAHAASAESLDAFFEAQNDHEEATPQTAAAEADKEPITPETAPDAPAVVKPQVLYLEDLNPPKKPETPAPSPVVAASPAPAPQTPAPAVLQNPVAAANPASTASGQIKREPLPKDTTQAVSTPKRGTATTTAAPQTKRTFTEVPQKSVVMDPNRVQSIPASTQTLSSFNAQNRGQYAPFDTQISRQQAARSLVKQAKNEGRPYPAGLDPFLIEFDQTFAVLSPNRAIRDLYKTAPVTAAPIQEKSVVSFEANPQTPEVPASPQPVVAEKTPETQDEPQPETPVAQKPDAPNTLVLEDALEDTARLVDHEGPSTLATVMVPETAEMLDDKTKSLLNQVASAYQDGTLGMIQITGYVNTRPAQGQDVRGYSQLQSLGRHGTSLVVEYLKQKQVPESVITYRVVPISGIVLQNPFYASSLASENTLRLDIAGGRS